ncbi:hypothetical protein GQX73_g5046 [Xylaria multiplex]|uniref:Uncharacterized protein n=1 Tax=Xylaria multiplex TaxID=323545 RepID=A0A7C8MUR2_9PEZI|nr:hypothetical protein GQX73_g5046 [Xylaria multiplex]
MDLAYINGVPQGPHEVNLIAQGFTWVHTNTIAPTQFNIINMAMNSGWPDRIDPHSHHGLNTHLVIKGDLYIQRQGHRGIRERYVISSFRGGTRQDLVPPNTTYSGASSGGCTFIEGHKCLSPQSAERFIDRGTLKLVRKPGATWRHPNDSDLKSWLRTVKFDPEGKAYPDFLKGEKPILDTSQVHPPIPRDFLNDLSEWFENEWQNRG